MSLELGRKDGQAIVFPTVGVRIVVRKKRGRIRLGVEAPREVPVLREELLQVSPARSTVRRSGVAAYRVLRIEAGASEPRCAISEPVPLATACQAVERLKACRWLIAGVVPDTASIADLVGRLSTFSAVAAAAGDVPLPWQADELAGSSVLECVVRVLTNNCVPAAE